MPPASHSFEVGPIIIHFVGELICPAPCSCEIAEPGFEPGQLAAGDAMPLMALLTLSLLHLPYEFCSPLPLQGPPPCEEEELAS